MSPMDRTTPPGSIQKRKGSLHLHLHGKRRHERRAAACFPNAAQLRRRRGDRWHAPRLGHRIYLFGGRKEVVEVLPSTLNERFPGIQVAGSYPHRNPPSTLKASRESVDAIQSAEADIVFVGFGQPRQEQWITDHRDRLPGIVLIGVGAAFDFLAGRVPQAPHWMQRAGLEWFFRLLKEPLRLWRRYILLNPLFLVMWGLQLAGLLRYETRRPQRPEGAAG